MVMNNSPHMNPLLMLTPSVSSFKLIFIVVMLLLTLFATMAQAQVTATTGRTVLSIDETISLEIKSKNSSGEPDLTVLENDFQILGRSQSQNYSLINGKASRTHTWTISLLPKKTGELIIPAIKVGNEVTKAIHLVVKKQSSTPGLDGKDVFLKVELLDNKTKDFYVQQQIILKVQLFHRIRFTNASLSDLELNNTVIEKLGNDSNYSKVIANNRYNIIEQTYALYPQQSGSLTIPALTFTGNSEISQNFSLFSRPGRQIISRSKPIELNILAIPDSYTGKNWLPAESLELEASILEDVKAIVAGEAITRHIVIRANGLLGSQLPANSMASSPEIKAYPDKEKLNNQLVNGQVIGTRRDTIAIIPLKPGPFVLPEIKVDWWNTKTNQQETATIPAHTLFAKPNSNIVTTPSVTQPVEPDIEKTEVTTKPGSDVEVIEKLVYQTPQLTKNIWFWISLGLLILWLITIALFMASRSKSKVTAPTPNKAATNNHEKYLQALYDACHKNDAHQSTLALIQWAKCYFKQPLLSGLSTIIDQVDNEHLINAINGLESVQYSGQNKDWDGSALSSALHQYIQQNKAQRKNMLKEKEQAFATLNP